MSNAVKLTLLTLLVLVSPTLAGEVEVFAGRPPGIIKYVYPKYPQTQALRLEWQRFVLAQSESKDGKRRRSKSSEKHWARNVQ